MDSTERATDSSARIVYVVDDDRGIRTSLVTLLSASGIQARPFADPLDMLAEFDFLVPGCVLIDVRMPSMSGIELLAALRERDCFWPAAIMTGHGEIPAAVRAMRLGAIEFIEKPFTTTLLMQVLQEGFDQLPEAVAKSARYRRGRRLISSLSPRQMQVFEGVVGGLTSKEIGVRHGLSHRTVESYRNDMMSKLGVNSLLELLELKILLKGQSLDD